MTNTRKAAIAITVPLALPFWLAAAIIGLFMYALFWLVAWGIALVLIAVGKDEADVLHQRTRAMERESVMLCWNWGRK